jgi:hypothetical protein
MNLKEAIAKGELKEFIKERSALKGDRGRFDSTLSSMVRQTSQEAPETSKPRPSDD